jgi:hypothetical protein
VEKKGFFLDERRLVAITEYEYIGIAVVKSRKLLEFCRYWVICMSILTSQDAQLMERRGYGEEYISRYKMMTRLASILSR